MDHSKSRDEHITKDNTNWEPVMRIFNGNDEGKEGENFHSIVRGTFVFSGFGIACGTDKGEIFINDTETGKRIMSMTKKDLKEIKRRDSLSFLNKIDIGVNDIRSDENGNYLMVCFSTGSYYIYDLRIGLNNKKTRINESGIYNINDTHKGSCTCIATPYNWEHNYVFTGGFDGYIRSWDLRKGNEYVTQVLAHEGPITSIEISPNSYFKSINDVGLNGVLSSTSLDGNVRLWKSSNLKLLKTFSGPNGSDCTLHSIFSKERDHNNNYYLFCTGNKSSCVWRIKSDSSVEKINIVNWKNDKFDSDEFDKLGKNVLIPKYTGFSDVYKDTYIIPRIVPTEREQSDNPFGPGDAIICDINTIINNKKKVSENSYLSIGAVSSKDSIITSVSVLSRNNHIFSGLNNDLLLTTSSYPDSSCVIWCNNTR